MKNEEKLCSKERIELLKILYAAEEDVQKGRTAPISDTFNDLREMLLNSYDLASNDLASGD